MNRDDWYGKNGTHVMCPVPDCGHVGSFISIAHLRIAHDLTRVEAQSLYGPAKQMPRKNNGWDIVRN